MKMRLQVHGLLLFSFGLILLLSACSGPQNIKLKISNVALQPGGNGTVTISVINPPDLKTIQVGPLGKFIFDPAVIRVLAVRGINGFQVLASGIDNAAGTVQFAAGFPGSSIGPIGDGWVQVKLAVVELEIEAVGPSGVSCSLEIDTVDLLADRNGREIMLAGIIAGEATIR